MPSVPLGKKGEKTDFNLLISHGELCVITNRNLEGSKRGAGELVKMKRGNDTVHLEPRTWNDDGTEFMGILYSSNELGKRRPNSTVGQEVVLFFGGEMVLLGVESV